MIWFWLIQAVRRFIWLFKLPKAWQIAFADPNEPCPVCGAKDGHLRCVLMAKGEPRAKTKPLAGQIFLQHTCNFCGARWHVEPIRHEAMDAMKVLPCVPRTEIEKIEDRAAATAAMDANELVAR
jgi:hypothetical protein